MTVDLIKYAHVVNQIVPGARVKEINVSPFGIQVAFYLTVNYEYNRAASEEHATEILTALAERVRIVGTRELGLKPIIDAWEAEIRDVRRENESLKQTVNSRGAQIVNLQEELELYRSGELDLYRDGKTDQ